MTERTKCFACLFEDPPLHGFELKSPKSSKAGFPSASLGGSRCFGRFWLAVDRRYILMGSPRRMTTSHGAHVPWDRGLALIELTPF